MESREDGRGDLSSERIEIELRRLGALIGRPLSVVGLTASTNDDAKRAAASGVAHGATFLADAQTAGRGRGGHTWHSPPGENLYLSIVLRPNVAATAIAPITLAVGLAVGRVVAEVVEDRALVSSERVTLKWPNDVYVDGLKIAGVLVEGQLRGERVAGLVAGIGLNVRMRELPHDIERTATSLALAGALELDRSRIAAALITELGRVVSDFEESGLDGMIAEIRARDFLHHRHVRVAGTTGVALGIDDGGCLLVRDAAGSIHAIASGEVLLQQPCSSGAPEAPSSSR